MAFRTADYPDEPDFPAAMNGHGSQGANFTAGGREHFASRPREAGDSVLAKTEGGSLNDFSLFSVPRFPLEFLPCFALPALSALVTRHTSLVTRRLRCSKSSSSSPSSRS
jgi:hypothetical protein